MSRVNLLPESLGTVGASTFVQRRSWRRALAAAALIWAGGAWGHVRWLDGRIEASSTGFEDGSPHHDQPGNQSGERSAEARAAWAEPIPAGAVIATLANLAPSELEFHSLVLEYPKPLGPKSRSEAIVVQVEGVAQEGAGLIRFTEQLLMDHRFRGVRMSGSDPKSSESTLDRRFRLSLEVPFVPPSTMSRRNRGE